MTPDLPDLGEYCREVEAYLCRKNDGHLIRIAGPSFTRVCSWAGQGIPLTVVLRGIDRYFERYYSKGPRRRPVQVDFCEADILDVFDEWRRAVGVWGGPERGVSTAESDSAPRSHHHTSLPAHLERAIVRLTTLRAGGRLSPASAESIDAAVRELDAAKPGAAHLRGEARAKFVERLKELDERVVQAVRDSIGDTDLKAIEEQARQDLSAFKGSMAAEAYERAIHVAAVRLLRERTGLPVLAYEE